MCQLSASQKFQGSREVKIFISAETLKTEFLGKKNLDLIRDSTKNMIDINIGPSQSSSLNDLPAFGVFKIKIGPQGAKKINVL